MKNADMPAMPIVVDDRIVSANDHAPEKNSMLLGLTKREQLAAMAMQGLLSNLPPKNYTGVDGVLVRTAVLYTDELLKELEK